MTECQAEDCHNVAAITTYWPTRESWCWTHYKGGCTCEDDRDDPLCTVHGELEKDPAYNAHPASWGGKD